MHNRFSIARQNRDAWSAIRGYVYQVDTTILRWLQIRPNEALELECGEDIDLLGPSIADTNADLQRTLEQVKCIDGNLTLRSEVSRQALASFVEHIAKNSNLNLQFRFLTTAAPTHERPAAPLLFTPGIELWEQIRTGRLDPVRKDAAVESIGAYLRSLPSTDAMTGAPWCDVINLSNELRRLEDVIARFEWSVRASQPGEVVFQIEESLLKGGYAPNRDEAKRLHDRLFVLIMRLLGRRKSDNPKRIDPIELHVALRSGTVTTTERKVLDELNDLRSLIAEGFSGVGEVIADVKSDTEEIKRLIYTGKAFGDEHLLRPVIDEPAVRDAFAAASSDLLGWPQESGGRWLDRPELAQLENQILNEDRSFTVLLGVPGSGKSALLARLGQQLEAGTTLLALKIDQLPQSIQTLGELDRHLGLRLPLVDAISDISNRNRIVLLVDQLDALAALMDQQTNRLSVVLQLVHRLKAQPNVHLLISCREFDFHYDARFSSLKAEKVHLSEPPWEVVQPFLTNLGIETGRWPREMRELMRNPQHLNVFVQNFAADLAPQTFETYQSMLEALFTKRVVNTYSAVTVAACEMIAAQMSDAEELWLPRMSLDQNFPHEVDHLLAAGVLTLSGRKVGFRHQTVFDYVRTRAFCTGAYSLSAHVLDRQDALFVRSTLWASLHALRSSSFERYCNEMDTLWEHPKLRRHVRLLLISFLGQVNEPDIRETQWLLPLLDDVVLRSKAIGAIVGNAGWFRRLQSRLPALMSGSDKVLLWQVATALQAGLAFERQTVFNLMKRHWSTPNRAELVLQTIRDLAEWDEQATSIVEGILSRQSINPYFVIHLAQRAAKTGSGFGARIVTAALTESLQRAKATPPVSAAEIAAEDDQMGDAARAILDHRKELDPFRKLIHTADWHGLEEVATGEPAHFIRCLWPWFVELASVLSNAGNPYTVQYRGDHEIELDDDMRNHYSHIPQALKIAMCSYADQDPDKFLEFTKAQSTSDLIVVHRLMSMGLERLSASNPDAILQYLLGDPRRMTLGGYSDRHRETRQLISAVADQLTVEKLAPLEALVLGFEMYRDLPHDDVQTRWERRRWNRKHRLHLIRAFPANRLSAAARKVRDEEEIALPNTKDCRSDIRGGFIESPVSAEQMTKAADRQILNLFDELQEAGRRPNPLGFLKGGMHEASQAFAAFAKGQPERAIALMDSFQPHTQELPAANAIHALAEVDGVDARALVDLFKRLVSRGFNSPVFRDWTGWALQKIAVKCEGLDDEVCGILKSWLLPPDVNCPDDPDAPEAIDPSKEPHSILWGPGGGGPLPNGNYPALSALGLGYRCRKPPAIDQWLDVLCEHLQIAERLSVWRTLVRDLSVLWAATDRAKAVEFLGQFFKAYPRALACWEGTIFLASSHRWLPGEFVRQSIEMLDGTDWPWKEQAIGEISMIRKELVPADEFTRTLVERAIEPGVDSPATDLRRVGIAFSCIHLWIEPEFRQGAHDVLARLGRSGDGLLPGAIMDLFRVAQNIPPDERTKEILGILVENPDLIKRGGRSFLDDRLKELLAAGFDPETIAEVVRTILLASEPDPTTSQLRWAADPGDLLEITISLQRLKRTRAVGLDLFEMLMDAGAYEANQMLRDLDRRII